VYPKFVVDCYILICADGGNWWRKWGVMVANPCDLWWKLMVWYFQNDIWQVMNNMLFHSILVGLKLMNSFWLLTCFVEFLSESSYSYMYFCVDRNSWWGLNDRLAKLSEGQIMDGNLECLYHGWQFNGSGTCVKIPQVWSAPWNVKKPWNSGLELENF
jgi:hypothetical protein